MSVSRFGVSLEEELLTALDQYVTDNNFANRSQAIRYLIEKNMVEQKWKCDNVVAGVVVLVFSCQKTDIRTISAELQFQYRDAVLGMQHFILSEQNCMEVISVKGASRRLTELSDKLISIKGIQHGKLIMSKTE
ncbi:MAG: nickel-responsive transcriptional regulator NikR [Prolixibacteraceae bacterium]|jgi:CopG family nickel-responsive transcriptional regulator